MRLFRQAKHISRMILPMGVVFVLVGCEQVYELGDLESEIDACQWAVVHYVAGELKISPVKESMEAVIELLKGHSESWARDAGIFLETIELGDKEVEEAMIAHNSGDVRRARGHLDSAIWLLGSALKEADRLEFDPNLGSMDSPDSPIGRGIREEEGREKRISLPPGDRPWDPFYMGNRPPPDGYLVEGDLHTETYLEITIWRLQLARDHLI